MPPPVDHKFDLTIGASDHYRDAVLYDHEYKRRTQDVAFYRRTADEFLGQPGEILELACGSGRITRTLLRAGHHVIALDRSAEMLARARARIDKLGKAARARGRLVRCDMRRFSFSRRFPMIIAGFNSFEHLYDNKDLLDCLDCARAHLARDGLLVFDVQNPNPQTMARSPNKRWGRTRFKHPVSGDTVEYSTSAHYDRQHQIEYIKFYYQTLEPDKAQRRLQIVRLAQRRFFPRELRSLLRRGGFRVDAMLGDFDGEPFGPDSDWQIPLCRPDPTVTERR